MACFEEQLAQQQVVTSAVIAYLDVLQAQKEWARKNVRLAGQLTDLAQHQLEVGVVTNLDVVRAQTSLAGHDHEQEGIQGVNTSFLNLKRVIGLPMDGPSATVPGRRAVMFEEKHAKLWWRRR